MAARIWGRTSFAWGLFQSLGPPDQSVFSLSWSRSDRGSPKTIAPRRPFPTGSASTHSRAGWAYDKVQGDLSGSRAIAGPSPHAPRQRTAIARPTGHAVAIPV